MPGKTSNFPRLASSSETRGVAARLLAGGGLSSILSNSSNATSTNSFKCSIHPIHLEGKLSRLSLSAALRAATMSFICWQSESNVSLSDTMCGFFPILFSLQVSRLCYISLNPLFWAKTLIASTIAVEDQSSIFQIVWFMSRIEEASRGQRWQHLMPSYGQFG